MEEKGGRERSLIITNSKMNEQDLKGSEASQEEEEKHEKKEEAEEEEDFIYD